MSCLPVNAKFNLYDVTDFWIPIVRSPGEMLEPVEFLHPRLNRKLRSESDAKQMLPYDLSTQERVHYAGLFDAWLVKEATGIAGTKSRETRTSVFLLCWRKSTIIGLADFSTIFQYGHEFPDLRWPDRFFRISNARRLNGTKGEEPPHGCPLERCALNAERSLHHYLRTPSPATFPLPFPSPPSHTTYS